MKAPTTLIILDGFALGEDNPGNAVQAARTPHLDYLFCQYPFCQLDASGLDVGLPDGQMGNSEVGHTNIGAGRVVFQDLPRISRAIEDGSFYQNPAYLAAMDACAAQGTALHLMGLVSDGGVHSHIDHLFALMELARRRGLEQLYIHAFLDGRDVSPTSGEGFVRQIQEKCRELGVGTIAHVMGRYYAMDRDSRWPRLQRAYDALVEGDAPFCPDPAAAVAASYAAGITDEFMEPVLCCQDGCIREGDSVIFFNFRPDRARELTRALTQPDFPQLKRKRGCFPLHFVCTTQYDAALEHVTVAFPHEPVVHCFGEYLSQLGMCQLRIAETEKYAHVTFFFNGGREEPFPGEDRVLIPSPEVATYDLKPSMSAQEVTREAVRRIRSGQYDVVILNFANCDMVGHTGVFNAAVQAVETVDECVAQVVSATTQMGGVALITADHGNAECMLDAQGEPFTAHTTNPVPFCIVGADVLLRDGRLADIAPTMLDLMGLNQPPEMDGRTLIL
ncbi:MAG: 2,3-bisphosphoglycerate-independent phosphoglycerate mutase [Ruminiclostridium sp.]|jgi:2,3-bisphosphoglycerate-independent phosphoglycerate mutase|nr:2,3-bisphosphoglycerate-independent phosphoglycerate mutase [Ruminiclostridium sp.]